MSENDETDAGNLTPEDRVRVNLRPTIPPPGSALAPVRKYAWPWATVAGIDGASFDLLVPKPDPADIAARGSLYLAWLEDAGKVHALASASWHAWKKGRGREQWRDWWISRRTLEDGRTVRVWMNRPVTAAERRGSPEHVGSHVPPWRGRGNMPPVEPGPDTPMSPHQRAAAADFDRRMAASRGTPAAPPEDDTRPDVASSAGDPDTGGSADF